MGLNVGGLREETVKLLGFDVPVAPPSVTVIGPVVAPLGTLATIWIAVAETSEVANVPLNMTILLANVVS
jgi:hypothetical protein